MLVVNWGGDGEGRLPSSDSGHCFGDFGNVNALEMIGKWVYIICQSSKIQCF